MDHGPVERHLHLQSSCTRQALNSRVYAILFAPASIASKLIPILPYPARLHPSVIVTFILIHNPRSFPGRQHDPFLSLILYPSPSSSHFIVITTDSNGGLLK